MESLWPVEEASVEKNEAIVILREQALEVKKFTGGLIKATFSKVTYKKGALSAMEKLADIVSKTTTPLVEEDDELTNKKDANEWYRKERYKFEIYSETYKFRLFILNYSELYPISIEIDEGIREEISRAAIVEVNDNEELKRVLREVFSSKKVQNVISKMKEIEKNNSNG